MAEASRRKTKTHTRKCLGGGRKQYISGHYEAKGWVGCAECGAILDAKPRRESKAEGGWAYARVPAHYLRDEE